MSDGLPVTDQEPLISALREENERLRAQNLMLNEQMAAAQAAQTELAKHLKVTAPLRRVQESLRHRAGEKRRKASVAGADVATSAAPTPPTSLAITDEQASRHPLLARTRDWLAGQPLLPEPDIRPVRSGCAGRVLVIVHVFYPELWPPLADRIARIPAPVDLVVTLVEGRSEALADSIVAQFPDARFEVVPNRGRDMWPFVRVLELGMVGDYDAVLKLHTKASVHRIDGAAWRDRLLDSLCPSPEGIGLILELLRRDPDVGMVAPAGAVLGREFWGSNGPMVDALGRADRDRRGSGACLVPGGVDVLEPARAAEPAARCTAHDRGLRARGGLDRWHDGARLGAVRGGTGRRRRAGRHRSGRGGR